MSQQIAIVMTEVFLRRLTPALMPFVRRQQDFRIVSIHRPIDELLDLLRDLEPDGLITEWLPEVTEALLKLQLPTVIADTDFSYPSVVSIDVDDWAVGAAAAEAFQRAGYRSFACLGNGTPYSGQRIDGFLQAVDSAVSVHTETVFENERYSEHFVAPKPKLRKWLESLPKPVGIFAVHDPLGRFLCSACQQLGISVPEQVAVIGANNDELVCGLSYPMLSSVSIPWHAIGALVGESMQKLLAQQKPSQAPILVSPGGVVMRHSANHLAVDDPQLRRAMSYLSERVQDSISIGQMCDDLRLARRSLERKFKEFYRCTPWEMLCRMRIARAKQLLVQTNHPISMISGLCGFNDAEQMAVVFKRVTGEAPSSFRKSCS
ncbi:substrate-binding domain-containing protein [Coraliomargarita sp. SDUM461004]|uniref:Substrate-binding domain-containing protein n=1 Tax=Thalassobacterium sedimentorum TaxID=3041258 RepID=A0ABU1AI56_9BACT|nr:substrate-binding domain-containing protein [Coraliomargarita sp. SDUM461004]MDQ8193313.1 substrate-binding domain-containing protein [Coraliomargarita sp. SDUM461004]